MDCLFKVETGLNKTSLAVLADIQGQIIPLVKMSQIVLIDILIGLFIGLLLPFNSLVVAVIVTGGLVLLRKPTKLWAEKFIYKRALKKTLAANSVLDKKFEILFFRKQYQYTITTEPHIAKYKTLHHVIDAGEWILIYTNAVTSIVIHRDHFISGDPDEFLQFMQKESGQTIKKLNLRFANQPFAKAIYQK